MFKLCCAIRHHTQGHVSVIRACKETQALRMVLNMLYDSTSGRNAALALRGYNLNRALHKNICHKMRGFPIKGEDSK
jgi:hypothetical protein